MPSKSVFISDSEIGTLDQTRVNLGTLKWSTLIANSMSMRRGPGSGGAAEALCTISSGMSKKCCGVASLRTEFLGFSRRWKERPTCRKWHQIKSKLATIRTKETAMSVVISTNLVRTARVDSFIFLWVRVPCHHVTGELYTHIYIYLRSVQLSHNTPSPAWHADVRRLRRAQETKPDHPLWSRFTFFIRGNLSWQNKHPIKCTCRGGNMSLQLDTLGWHYQIITTGFPPKASMQAILEFNEASGC